MTKISEINSDKIKVVLFGSILTDPENARDVDVAVGYAGTWEEYLIDKPVLLSRAQKIVERWASDTAATYSDRHDGVATMSAPAVSAVQAAIRNRESLDMHYVSIEFSPMPGTEVYVGENITTRMVGAGSVANGPIRIPAPFGTDVSWMAITPDTQVETFAVYSIPAAIRAFGHDRDKLQTAMAFLLTNVDVADSHGDFLGVPLPLGGGFPRPGLGRLYAAHIDIGGPYADEREDWSDYVTGLKALRSAIEHAPAWKAAQFPGKRLLARLNARGASREGIQYARNYSPGDKARLFLRSNGVMFEYSDLVSYQTAEEMFVR